MHQRITKTTLLLSLLPAAGSFIAYQIYVGYILTSHYSLSSISSSEQAFESVQRIMDDNTAGHINSIMWSEALYTTVIALLFIFGIAYSAWLIVKNQHLSDVKKTIWLVLTAIVPHVFLPVYCLTVLFLQSRRDSSI